MVPQFVNETGVIFELVNEPGPGPNQMPTATDWKNWTDVNNTTNR
jgi:hypothetical protein